MSEALIFILCLQVMIHTMHFFALQILPKRTVNSWKNCSKKWRAHLITYDYVLVSVTSLVVVVTFKLLQ